MDAEIVRVILDYGDTGLLLLVLLGLFALAKPVTKAWASLATELAETLRKTTERLDTLSKTQEEILEYVRRLNGKREK